MIHFASSPEPQFGSQLSSNKPVFSALSFSHILLHSFSSDTTPIFFPKYHRLHALSRRSSITLTAASRNFYCQNNQLLTSITCCSEHRGSLTNRSFSFSHSKAPTRGAFFVVKIRHHESKTSLFGGQSLDRSYTPLASDYTQREGYGSGKVVNSQGRTKMYRPNSTWSWSFVIVSLLQAAIVLGFEA